MASSFEGAVLDLVKCSKLSMEERREIVYELANWSHGAAEMLQTWSRQDILQILCFEMGKERKYTGLTKLKIIEQLLKLVSEKNFVNHESGVHGSQSFPIAAPKCPKRPRKPDHSAHLPVSATHISSCTRESDSDLPTYCKNSACKARLSKKDKFCKRCTCCICHKYDDNKDPSLWLTCGSEAPFLGDSCNMSCHLECAIKHDRSGIARNGRVSQLDGSFYCISCGKMNDLMSCWRKQLVITKDTRRVDILCYRISLSQKLIAGTKKYQKPCDIVDDAIKLLEAEVGILTGVPVKMGRGIVNRLSSGQEVQRLCASAVDMFDSMYPQTTLHQGGINTFASLGVPNPVTPNIIRVEAINATSVTVILGPDNSSEMNVGYTLWHRKADDQKDPAQPTCNLVPPQTQFMVSGLLPSTEYIFKVKVVSFDKSKELSSSEVRLTTSVASEDISKSSILESIQSPPTNDSTLSNPSSVEDETNNIAPCSDSIENKSENYFNCGNDLHPSCASEDDNMTGKFDSSDQSDTEKVTIRNTLDNQVGEAMSTDNESSEPPKLTNLPSNEPGTSLPITPCRQESLKDGSMKRSTPKSNRVRMEQAETNRRCSSMKRFADKYVGDDPSGSNLEYYIKVIRWLECDGHIDKNFRQKFLTWYGIRATPQESRIVKVFIDTLIDDPASLSEQLQDTFEEIISSKRVSVVTPGVCLRLWH